MTIVMASERGVALLHAKGTTEDYAAASVAALEIGGRVYTYPVTESDPLGRARRDFAADKRNQAMYWRRYHPCAG